MGRKLLFTLCIGLALAALSLPALAQDATPEATEIVIEPWVCPEGFEGQTLNVYNWSTYVAEDTISNFEEACGVTVNYDVFGSNDELLSRLRGGNPGFDILVPSDYVVAIMAAEGLLEPLSKENIPNFANVTPELLNPPYDPDNVYSAPYQWGTIGIGYNREAVGADITSWQQVFDYEGNVAWLDEARVTLGIALSILGYDPNSSNPDEIAEARDFLVENGQNVVSIAADDGQAQLERGDVDIAVEFNGDIYQLAAEAGEQFVYVIPEEGTNIWVDNMVIPVGAPNKPLAEVFIDYILHPQVGADISNYTAYASPNQVAIEAGLIDEVYLSDPGIYPTQEILSKMFFVEDNPEGEQYYNDAWSEIKILLGQ
jgi:spermidine/putrescine transport system substrate-binding protein